MKIRLLHLLVILFFLSSCSSSYYFREVSLDTPIYHKKSKSGRFLFVIPKGEKVFVRGKSKYKKIKYKNHTGWAYLPLLVKIKDNKRSFRKVTIKSKKIKNYSCGPVYVRGYYRKDGTYVRPHTRRRRK